jgi:signal transduction histidine kinase
VFDPPASHPGPRSAPVLRRLFVIFVPTALMLGAVVLAFYHEDRANDLALSKQTGKYLVDLQADIIQREYSAVESDLLYLADQSVLHAFVSGATAKKAELAHEYLQFCRRKGLYDQVRYLDATGREVIRVNDNNGAPAVVPDQELQAKAARYYFVQTMRLDRNQVFISPFDLNVEHEQIERPLKPTVRFSTPVFDEHGHKAGVLILNYLGDVLLQKLIAVATSGPGKMLLVNGPGYFLHGPSPETEWGFMFDNGQRFENTFPEAWPAVTSSERGSVRTAQGLFTFRTVARPGVAAADSSASESQSPAALDSTLRVVSFIPDDVLWGRTTEFLMRMLVVYGVALVLIFVLAWYLAYTGALRSHQQRRMEESEARLRTLSTQLITAQEDERRRLSRDLHDEMGQMVTSMSLDLQRAAQAADDPKRQELIGRAARAAESLLSRIHEISTQLRPTLLDDLGLKDAVQSYLAEYERCTGILPRAVLRFDQPSVPPVIGQNVFRILQEALTNVAKHARASEVDVELYVTATQVSLTVRDDGVGFAPGTVDERRLGLLGMRERAELFDGAFLLKSSPGKGTELAITIPIRAHGQGDV